MQEYFYLENGTIKEKLTYVDFSPIGLEYAINIDGKTKIVSYNDFVDDPGSINEFMIKVNKIYSLTGCIVLYFRFNYYFFTDKLENILDVYYESITKCNKISSDFLHSSTIIDKSFLDLYDLL